MEGLIVIVQSLNSPDLFQYTTREKATLFLNINDQCIRSNQK